MGPGAQRRGAEPIAIAHRGPVAQIAMVTGDKAVLGRQLVAVDDQLAALLGQQLEGEGLKLPGRQLPGAAKGQGDLGGAVLAGRPALDQVAALGQGQLDRALGLAPDLGT